MITDNEKIAEIANTLREMRIDAHDGLPEELFLMISGVMPIPNVDLMITNSNGQILLSWRDDIYYGKGWHIPGGCIRFGETMMERIQKTALEEIGTHVVVREEPIIVKDVICRERKDMKYPNERGHNVTILYSCRLPDHFLIDNNGKKENEAGYLKWFDKIPDNILKVHEVYAEIFSKWEKNK